MNRWPVMASKSQSSNAGCTPKLSTAVQMKSETKLRTKNRELRTGLRCEPMWHRGHRVSRAPKSRNPESAVCFKDRELIQEKDTMADVREKGAPAAAEKTAANSATTTSTNTKKAS